MNELTGLRVFREIVECGSFAAAAERLALSAPMVSKHLARLERRLGARLLHRSSRGLSLTEAGVLYHGQCRQALDILDAAEAELGQAGGAPRGELKVSAPVWFANRRIARLLAEYRRRCPEVRLDLHLDNRHVDLVSEGFDLALRATAEPSPQLIARPLCPLVFHLVATPAYLASRDDAGPLHLILPNYVQIDWRRVQEAAPLGGPIDAVMKSSDSTLSYQAVLSDMGAAILPGWLVDEDLAAGRLLSLPFKGFGPTGALFAVYTSRRQMPPKLRSFIDFLSERLGDPAAAGAAG